MIQSLRESDKKGISGYHYLISALFSNQSYYTGISEIAIFGGLPL